VNSIYKTKDGKTVDLSKINCITEPEVTCLTFGDSPPNQMVCIRVFFQHTDKPIEVGLNWLYSNGYTKAMQAKLEAIYQDLISAWTAYNCEAA
jgi:hypothetical protein